LTFEQCQQSLKTSGHVRHSHVPLSAHAHQHAPGSANSPRRLLSTGYSAACPCRGAAPVAPTCPISMLF
jgi:hypothetical protein